MKQTLNRKSHQIVNNHLRQKNKKLLPKRTIKRTIHKVKLLIIRSLPSRQTSKNNQNQLKQMPQTRQLKIRLSKLKLKIITLHLKRQLKKFKKRYKNNPRRQVTTKPRLMRKNNKARRLISPLFK